MRSERRDSDRPVRAAGGARAPPPLASQPLEAAGPEMNGKPSEKVLRLSSKHSVTL